MWKCIEDQRFLHCTPLPSQHRSFVGLCHSLICCIVGSHDVWLGLKNYHSNQLSTGKGFLWVKKEHPPTPAVLCWVHQALLSSSLSSGSGVLNGGKQSLTGFDHSCWGSAQPIFSCVYHSERCPECLFQSHWGILVVMTRYSVPAVRTLELTLFLPSKSLW